MEPVVVVVVDVFIQPGLGNLAAKRPGTKQLLLDCPVKAFDVSVVIGLPDSAVAQLDLFAPQHVLEPGSKLRAVVGLDGLECKAKEALRFQECLVAPTLGDTVMHTRMCHAGVQVNDRVEVKLFFGLPIQEVNRIRLHQAARGVGRRPCHWRSVAFPFARHDELVPFERPFDTAERNDNTAFGECGMNDFGTAFATQTLLDNGSDDFL